MASAKGSADLNQPSMRLAALRASTSQAFVQQTIPRATLVLTRDYDEAIGLVLQDKVEAMVATFQPASSRSTAIPIGACTRWPPL